MLRTKKDKTPIWIMRQAGRYLPEYLNVRKSVSDFLEFCYDKTKVVEVTLQPIRRFGFDAAIIFSDILVLPHALGWGVRFEENIGPILQQFKSNNDFADLKENPSKLEEIYHAIKIVREKLDKDTFLIGFAGSPWTVASYMLEGRGKQDFSVSKKFVYENWDLTKKLIDFITEKTILHLAAQAEAGVDVLQLFDSWAGVLSGREYEELVIKPTIKIVTNLKKLFPEILITGFPRASGFMYEKYIKNTKIDIIGVDQFVPIEQMKKWREKVIVQGNLDPVILLTDKKSIAAKADHILENLAGKNFIFNLGHGILPSTPIENVEFLVNHVRQYKS